MVFMEPTRVTVCIPSYNQGNWVSGAIESVLNQTYGNFELIIIDCSTDHSKMVLSGYTDPRIKVIHTQFNYMADKLNIGFKQGVGELCCFLSADDLYKNNYLERMVGEFTEDPELGFCHPDIDVRIKNKDDEWVKEEDKSLYYYSPIKSFKDTLEHNNVGAFYMFRKKIFNDLGFWVGPRSGELYSEDYDFALRVIRSGYKTKYIEERLATYSRHEGSATYNLHLKGYPILNSVREEFKYGIRKQ